MQQLYQQKKCWVMKKIKVAIFGLGQIYNRIKSRLGAFDIIALIDNNSGSVGYVKEAVRPEDVDYDEIDAVIISSVHVEEMRRQLLDIGVMSSKIYTYKDIDHLLFETEKDARKQNYCPRT